MLMVGSTAGLVTFTGGVRPGELEDVGDFKDRLLFFVFFTRDEGGVLNKV
jgi:hypothetical protein